MRQRKLKHVNKELMENRGVLVSPKQLDLTNVYLEIGAGKGEFITSLALDNPNKIYVALEINIDICFRILEKKEALKLDNLIIILDDANNLLNYLPKGSIKELYLNFSDPWPKPRHHKRRLTYQTLLDLYLILLSKDGVIQVRTDHKAFFMDSLDYIENRFKIIDKNYNLPSSKYQTEYEKKKRLKGPIYQMKASRLDD